MIRKILQFALIIGVLILVGCNKAQESNKDKILGKWVSTDKTDTLIFVDYTNFWKGDTGWYNGDHFNYQLIGDSIKVQYSGKLFIYVNPTMHKYYFNNNDLTIDFSNRECYGFPKKEISYTRN